MFLSNIVRYHQILPGIVNAQKNIDDPVPNWDFPVLLCLGIALSVLGIRSYNIRKCMSKIYPITIHTTTKKFFNFNIVKDNLVNFQATKRTNPIFESLNQGESDCSRVRSLLSYALT
jgi:hypothetical protein